MPYGYPTIHQIMFKNLNENEPYSKNNDENQLIDCLYQ